jgi:hypothetical protein
MEFPEIFGNIGRVGWEDIINSVLDSSTKTKREKKKKPETLIYIHSWTLANLNSLNDSRMREGKMLRRQW